MHLFALTTKIKLWKTLHPNEESSCQNCPINNITYGWSTTICENLIAIFQKRYNMPSVKTIYGLCPVPFMDREDFGDE